MSERNWRTELEQAADTQHTAALTWQECRSILASIDAYRHASGEAVTAWKAGIVAELDSIDGGDPEAAHDRADDILLTAFPIVVQDAYKRLMDRCAWWASA